MLDNSLTWPIQPSLALLRASYQFGSTCSDMDPASGQYLHQKEQVVQCCSSTPAPGTVPGHKEDPTSASIYLYLGSASCGMLAASEDIFWFAFCGHPSGTQELYAALYLGLVLAMPRGTSSAGD